MTDKQLPASSWTDDDPSTSRDGTSTLDPRELARRLFDRHPSFRQSTKSLSGAEPPKSDRLKLPKSIAGYRVKNHIGRGAFGNVFLCQEKQPPHRELAVKVIRAGMDSNDILARFEVEKNALSMMNHPAIARVIDAGATEDGLPYFAMEYVEGLPLTEFCSQQRLTLDDRLRLFIDICHGVQHAHSKAVVHRDLKPSNIMVTRIDGVPRAKIIDFGLVKSLQQTLGDQTIHTRQGIALGTYEYMSPEQVKSSGIDVDTRSDIYALGALLYELLTGELAFAGLRECGYAEIVRMIMREDAVRPSQRVRIADADRSRQHAATMQSELNSLSRCLATDLDWIAMKALEKDPERRYQACQEMANDIERYLNGELVEARPPSATYRLIKTVRRYRKTLTVTSLLILSLLMGMSWALIERDNARASQLRSDEVTEYLAGIFADIDLESMAVQLRRTFSNNKMATTETAGLNGIALEQHLQQTEEFTSKINWIELAKKSLEPGIINSSLNKTDAIEDPLQRAALLQILSNTLRKMASLDAAIVPQQEALAIRQRELGIDHPDTLNSIHNLGLLQLDQGNQLEVQASGEKHNDALRNFEKAHEGRLSVLGSDHRETLESTFAIAMVTMRIGKGRQAIDIFRKVLESRRRALGDHDPATLTSMQHLGVLLTGQGDNDEARLLLEEVLEIRRSELPADDRQLIGSMTSMANVLIYLEDGNLVEENLDEAQALLDEALESCRHVFTEDHPTTLTVLKSMGKLFSARGKHAEAQQYYKEALAGFRRIEGNNSRNTLRMINDMGVLLLKQKKLVEAKLLLEEGLEGRRRVLPDDHIQIAMSYHNLGWVHRELGDLEKADFFGAEAVRRCHDRQQWCIGFVNWKYSLTLVALNRFAEAEIHAKKAWSRLETWKHFSAEKKIEYIEGRVALYDAWHKVEPDAGHDQSAARWRAKLEEAAAAT
jgi:non-specific serine/threonine protein kinase/serine/threonine-protein kinase